ncbi:uncharacterized protein LOC131011107 [Salvia miltiorrhiza]|uniref:uncharacterized protein LOC131011107 n=1 Tax=Salvia miltiorrhiza TaxID=226208 RepID=UPI0025AB614B|nr:uncharacterized protein LOC131011107 [Salvia miltiorrhiza]
MEAVMMHGSLDQSISPYKSSHPKKFHQNPIISYPSDAFWLSHFNSIGLLQPPPPQFLSQSYPLRQSSQPPLLPLPASARGLSNKKSSSLASKKSKSPKKEAKNSPKKSKDAAKVIGGAVVVGDQVDMFSGSAVFTISPPPSSLPLPTFSLRPKLSCKAEAAAGVDAGATDDLRRLLRLL